MNRRKRVLYLLVPLALLAVALGVFSGQASASVGTAQEIPAYSNLKGVAVIDSVRGTFNSWSRTASGRVELILTQPSAIGKIQYAPFTRLGPDGEWNTLTTYHGQGSVVLRWSDTFHMTYDGFKFRICGANVCGSSQTYIYF
jgi:hypothetical protein